MAIFKHKILVVLLSIAAVLTLIALGTIALRVDHLSTPLIIHFDAYHGIDFFGTRADLWGIGAIGALALVLNTFLAEAFFYRERLLTYVFMGANVLVSLFFLIAVIVIVSVN